MGRSSDGARQTRSAVFLREREFRMSISRQWLRGVHESVVKRNTTTREDSTGVELRYQRFEASWPIAEHRVVLRPIVLEYRCSRQISPIRRDHISPYLRKCSPTRKKSLASSLLLPFRRHMLSAAPALCALAGLCSLRRDRRSRHPQKCH